MQNQKKKTIIRQLFSAFHQQAKSSHILGSMASVHAVASWKANVFTMSSSSSVSYMT